MKAINIDQPWAELIIQGRKTIELRTKRSNHRGPLAIRATKTVLTSACDKFDLDPEGLITGAIVGVVDLVEVIKFDQNSWQALRDRHLNEAFAPGRWHYGWRLENPKRLKEPIYYRGIPGMFNLPEEIAEQLKDYA
jgi:hypothetical protein